MIVTAMGTTPIYSANVVSSSMTGNYLLDTGVLGNSGSFYANAVLIEIATSPLTVSSAYVMFTVNPALKVSSVSAVPSTVDSGQSSTLTATASGGAGSGYIYTWYNDASCTPGDAMSGNTVSPATTTTYCVSVTDGIGASTNTVTVNVNTALTIGDLTPAVYIAPPLPETTPSYILNITTNSQNYIDPGTPVTTLINVTEEYNCSIPSGIVVPFVFYSKAWYTLIPYTANSSAAQSASPLPETL